jgi:2,4-dienoyl-CoA reductase-like NADH-dependent reductase (Old Yellow Enzyme family)
MIWLEAVSVCQEGRSNPGQLYITEETLPGFRELARRIYAKASGEGPVTILQLNHSGRYSKPEGVSAPIIAGRKAELDERLKLAADHPVVTDEYMDDLIDKFVKAAVLAKEAGFDGVDIKACHGYLLHDFFSCFDREGKYGGSFENRTRPILDIIDRVREAVNDPEFIIASRINIYDAMPVSKGWGTDLNDFSKVDLTEPVRLVEAMVARGTTLINVTMGNPYFIPHINRPYDLGAYFPEESPLEGTYRLIHHTAELQKRVPKAKIVGVGYSWLREFSPYVAAWVLETGGASLIGYGRQFIAYPDFAKDIIETGRMQKNKVCVACSKCAMLKRDKGLCGCVVRDSAAYLRLYMDTYKKEEKI